MKNAIKISLAHDINGAHMSWMEPNWKIAVEYS